MTLKEKIINLFVKIRNAQLPSGLRKHWMNRVLMSLFTFVITVIAVVITKNLSFMIGLIISGYILITGLKIRYDYVTDKIIELKMLCISASTNNLKKEVDVIMQDTEGENHRFTCIGTHHRFFKDVEYLIYVNTLNEQIIITYEEI